MKIEESTMNRRAFIGAGVSALATGVVPQVIKAASKPSEYKGLMLLMTDNMWRDYSIPEFREANTVAGGGCDRKIWFDEDVFVRSIDYAVEHGCNMLLLDVGDAVVFPSHPELAVGGSLTPEHMLELVKRFRRQGLEVVPKLNFSSTHDSWLKDYHKMLTTPQYYRVCADLIRDIAEIFDHPKNFHIGMDEETYRHQWKYDFIVLRQRELWWHDFKFLVNETEKNNMRCWTWCSVGYSDPEKFCARIPSSVLPTTGHYDEELEGFDMATLKAKFPKSVNFMAQRQMQYFSDHGIDQIPCVSNWLSSTQKDAGMKENAHSTEGVVKFSREHLDPAHLRGFFAAPWCMSASEEQFKFTCRGFDLLSDAIKKHPAV